MVKAKLIGNKELAPGVRHFDFELPEANEFRFTPGQFVSVIHHVDGKEITRAYSIASPRSAHSFSLCLNKVDEGLVSPYLFSLRPGDEIEVSEPLGYFTLRHPGHRAVFVATGTGIAPFRSMLLEHLPKTQPHVTLLFGVRYEQGLLYGREFETLARDYPSFRFIPTITRPSESWHGRTGRVQSHLDEALNLKSAKRADARRQAGEELAEPSIGALDTGPVLREFLNSYEDKSTLDVYICGLKEMVDDVRGLLKQRGFDRKQIIYEKYD